MNLPKDNISLQNPNKLRAKSILFVSNYYPLLLAILLQQILIYIATLGIPYSIFHVADFVRWDSGLYFDIASNGYELFPCHERFSGYPANSTEWCGNAGWMPLYPYLIRLLNSVGIHEYIAGYWISMSGNLAVLFFIFSICRKYSKTTCLLTMILAGIFPSSIYYHAAFPISLILSMLLGSFYFWRKQHFFLANLFAFLIPLSYSTGFLSILPWAIFTMVLFFTKRKLFLKTIPVIISIALGYLTFFVILKVSTGHWNAFFLIQKKYGHGFHDIIQPVWGMIRGTYLSGINNNWQNIQSLMFIVLLLFVSIQSFFEKDLDVLFANLCFVTFALFPILVGSNLLAQYRSEALLLPLVLFLGQRKTMALAAMPVFIYLTLNCAIEFFTSKIS